MKSYKTQTLSIIRGLKSRNFGSVSIDGFVGAKPFQLVLITADCARDSHIIRLLAKWRKKHETWFLSQFPVTVNRTGDWLIDRVLGEGDRLLFMIRVHGTYRGHIGLYRFDYTHKTCDIDNIVRGRVGYPGLMAEAITSMMSWGKSILGVTGFTLQTTSDNIKALALYTKLGFVETGRLPLAYSKSRDGGEWKPVPDGHPENIKRYEVYMKLHHI